MGVVSLTPRYALRSFCEQKSTVYMLKIFKTISLLGRALKLERTPSKEVVPPRQIHSKGDAATRRVSGGPSVGLLNLLGPASREIFANDAFAMAQIFGDERVFLGERHEAFLDEKRGRKFDVLFLYCDLQSSMEVLEEDDLTLRDVIRISGAKLVVIASNTSGETIKSQEFANALPLSAHLIVTLNRNGDAFIAFFINLFLKMLSGTPLELAWVQIAPQSPHSNHNGPESILIAAAAPRMG